MRKQKYDVEFVIKEMNEGYALTDNDLKDITLDQETNTVPTTQCGGTPTADASGAAKPAGWPCPNCQQGFSFVSLQEFLGHLPLRLLHICQAKSISEISALKSPFSSFF